MLTSTNGPLWRVQFLSRNPDGTHQSLKKSLNQEIAGRLEPPRSVDITVPATIDTAIEGADVVVSAVGIMHGTTADFERIQWKGAENIALAARAAGAKLVHISAIGADKSSSIAYARTKGLGEEAVFKVCPDATIIRPSIMFGPGDGFFGVRIASFDCTPSVSGSIAAIRHSIKVSSLYACVWWRYQSFSTCVCW